MECLTGFSDDESQFAVSINDANQLTELLKARGFRVEVQSKRTAINEYDFPQLADGTRLSEQVPLAYVNVRVLQPINCRQRTPDARTFGVQISTFNDVGRARLFHSQSARSRTVLSHSSDTHPVVGGDTARVTFADIVVTTVDDSDPVWREKMHRALAQEPEEQTLAKTTNPGRFKSHDELRYLLRSIFCYAPWVRTIHIVTDDQCPPWLDTSHPMINLVDHKDIIDPQFLPTFNSDAIESCLWKIRGLSEEFVYFNDDMLLMALTKKEMFFGKYGMPRFFASPRRLPDIPAKQALAYTSNAHIRTADALEAHGFERPTIKFKHIPYAGKKSIFQEIEREFPDELEETRSSTFRSEHSLATISFLYENFALATKQGQLSNIKYSYIEIADTDWKEQLLEVCRGTQTKIVCINDSSTVLSDGPLETDLQGILSSRYPKIPPWEKVNTER
jgi:hypothetical protein